MNESRTLLAQYAAGSEAAFREIVENYLNLVFSTALRLVNGDAHLAEDIAQTVFLDLARSSKSLSNEIRLGGWLHRHTCYIAAKMIRTRRRREAREKEAAEMTTHNSNSSSEAALILDEAINQLSAADRAAIVLRFFEGLDLRAVGQALGSNEDAAQKRISRALEKLNRTLRKNGVRFSGACLATALLSQAVSAAPAGMTTKIASSVLLAAPESASTFSLIKFMAASKTKLAGAAALFVVGVTVPLLFNHDATARVADLDKQSIEQTAALSRGQRENERLAAQIEKLRNDATREAQETAHLREEAEVLRGREVEIKSLRQEIHQLGMRRSKEQTPWQNREENNARQRLTKAWNSAFHQYATAHGGKFPVTFEEAKPYFPTNAIKGAIPASEHFEILYTGTIQALTNLDPNLQFIIFRERKLQPLLHNYGGTNYNKMGRFAADANGYEPWGSAPVGMTDAEFSDWEQRLRVPPGIQ